MSDPVRMPLADAARALGTTPDALRQKIKRGKLQAVRDNAGRLLVWVDSNTLTTDETSSRSVGVQSEHPNDLSGHVKSLEDHVKSLTARLEVADRQADQLRTDHKAGFERLQAMHTAEVARLLEERARLLEELQKARTDAYQTKVDQDRITSDISTVFDKLKEMSDLLATVNADRAQLKAELESHHSKLQKNYSPWWKKYFS